jgi:hypothetical protein
MIHALRLNIACLARVSLFQKRLVALWLQCRDEIIETNALLIVTVCYLVTLQNLNCCKCMYLDNFANQGTNQYEARTLASFRTNVIPWPG